MKWEKQGLIYNKFHSQLPIITKTKNGYKSYITPRDELNKSYIKEIEFNLDPLVIHSDKKNILTGSLDFDIDGTMGSCILNINEEEYLYYTGWKKNNNKYKHNICLAINLNKILHPIIESNSEDFYICSSPFIIFDNIYRMWFISGKGGDGWINCNNTLCPTYTINYAESNDAITWKRKNINFNRKENEIFSRPFVFKENNIYKMLYSKMILKIPKRYIIGYAESDDGINWKRLDKEVGIFPSIIKDEWDYESIAFPWIENNYLFYSGNKFGKLGFGYAKRIL